MHLIYILICEQLQLCFNIHHWAFLICSSLLWMLLRAVLTWLQFLGQGLPGSLASRALGIGTAWRFVLPASLRCHCCNMPGVLNSGQQ